MRRPLLAVGLAAASAALLVAQQPATDSPAALAAKKRQDAIKSIEIRYHMKEIIEQRSQQGLPGKGPEKKFPEAQLTLESDNRIVLASPDIRVERNHPVLMGTLGTYLPMRYLGVIRGDVAKSYLIRTDEPVRRDNSDATIVPRRVGHIGDELTLLPFNLHCQGFATTLWKYSFAGGHWQPAGVVQQINGVALQQYRLANTPDGATTVGWVDPKQDYAMRRIRTDIPKNHSFLIDATYQTDALSGIVIPQAWTYTRFDPTGKLLYTKEFRVTSARVNFSPADAEFELDFPPNVLVYNEIENNFSLVRADGSLKWLPNPFADDDIRRDANSTWWWRQRWIGFGSILSILFAVLFWLRSRRRRTHST